MTQSGRSIRGRSGNMHPLFRELYLSDPDGSDEPEVDHQANRRRVRAHRKTLQKQVNRKS